MTKPKTVGSKQSIQLKITLKGSDPAIWRRVVLPSNYHLGRLHTIIQMAMGWTNSHLHQFEIDGQMYELLEIIKNPAHPEYEEKSEWLGRFDPAEFDLDGVNSALKDFAKDPEAEWGRGGVF